ncbi:ABC transporter substrate-binding protein [Nocardioides renjunii]|uniref:ABC transporter substrate-binding protein n=1 Tax=Nocardioides renjunii TaxID=3095075 RepID=UPI002AFF305A|nr:extracellular solute-binding protein [Nocardioides sp. S-34]WQQ20685.1 extracellular solute-binding protein [Nocardioides sp. S-34]
MAVLACTMLAVTAACGGDGDEQESDADSITVWIVEDLPDRVKAAQAIVDDFTQSSGIDVELTAVAEDQFNQILTSNAAAGDLPDAIGALPLSQVRTLSANELVDTEAVAAVMESLDPATFNESAVELTADGDEQLAVPSESWVQLLVYRKDLFEEAGLAEPTTYDDVLAAAEELDSPEVAGFLGANVAGDAFTAQTFEEIGLGNNCQMVDDAGEVTLDSDECVEALDFYGQLQQDYSVTGAQDVDTTRAAYFAGQGAMLIWSSFVLDELAGLRNDALPSCPECKDDPKFLAENSGVVTSIQGPSGSEPATYGEVTSWTIPAEAATAPAQEFVEYMMNDGYEPWIEIAPEGKIPVRPGDSPGATNFSDAWSSMEVGVDTKAPLSDFYGPDVIDQLTGGVETLQRWAIPQGQGDLLGAIQGEQPVANAVNQVAGGTDAADAMQEAADAVRTVQDSLP